MWWEFPKELVKSSTVKDESGSREACLLSSKMWPLSHRVTSPHSFSLVLIQKRLFGSLLTLLLTLMMTAISPGPKDTQPQNTLYVLDCTRTHTMGNVRNNNLLFYVVNLREGVYAWEELEERKGRGRGKQCSCILILKNQ